jgi:hypothetical protein
MPRPNHLHFQRNVNRPRHIARTAFRGERCPSTDDGENDEGTKDSSRACAFVDRNDGFYGAISSAELYPRRVEPSRK